MDLEHSVGQRIQQAELSRPLLVATQRVLLLHVLQIALLTRISSSAVAWILSIIFAGFVGACAAWSYREKRRIRNSLLGNRDELPVQDVVKLFNASNKYDRPWLLSVLDELAQSTSTNIGLLRPADKLGEQLKPIKGFEGFDRFDWVPNSVYEKLCDELSASQLIDYLWLNRFGRQ